MASRSSIIFDLAAPRSRRCELIRPAGLGADAGQTFAAEGLDADQVQLQVQPCRLLRVNGESYVHSDRLLGLCQPPRQQLRARPGRLGGSKLECSADSLIELPGPSIRPAPFDSGSMRCELDETEALADALRGGLDHDPRRLLAKLA
jgi:hypothetical protein